MKPNEITSGSKPVRTGDDILTVLASKPRDAWRITLAIFPRNLLQEAADLCGVDAVGMSKNQAIKAIVENF
jgi:hypothetical protein